MQILQIRFKNLNALRGEWVIDLTHPTFVSDGIFAIIGSTGAGKTTILDAICLALYGRTPRLAKITRRDNALMSRRTGECFAEVVFQTQKGCYRSHWSQHRARKKSNGELQSPRHEIAETESGRILQTKILEVSVFIEQVTGMDFERFTKSILLAQGGFAAFLQADSDARAPLLEQITGTDIYSRISIKAHERQRAEAEKLVKLEAEMAGIVILDSEQITEINRQLRQKQLQETEINEKMHVATRALNWLLEINSLQAEIKTLSAADAQLKTEIAAFKPERERLQHAELALGIEGDYSTLLTVRKHQTADQQLLESETVRLAASESAVNQKQTILREAETATVNAKAVQKQTASVIQKTRILDNQLSEIRKSIETETISYQKIADQVTSDQQQLSQHKKQLKTVNKELNQIQDYLLKNTQDERLLGELAGIEVQIDHLTVIAQNMTEKEAAQTVLIAQQQSAVQVGADHSSQLQTEKLKQKKLQKQLECKKKALKQLLNGRQLREYRTEKEALLREIALLRKISDLESERQLLEAGKPCPLCGSLQHPYVTSSQTTQIDETEKHMDALARLIEKAEQHETAIQSLEATERQALDTVSAAEKQVADALNAQLSVKKGLQDLTTALEKDRTNETKLQHALLSRLQDHGITTLTGVTLPDLLQQLKDRLSQWQQAQLTKTVTEKRISELEMALKTETVLLDTHQKILLEKQTAFQQLEQTLARQQLERNELFGKQNPEQEEKKLEKAVVVAEQAEKIAREDCDVAKQLLYAIQVNQAALKTRIENRISELQDLEKTFLDRLHSAGFVDEQQFVAYRLSPQELNQLKTTMQALDTRCTAMAARIEDKQKHLSVQLQNPLTESTKEQLEIEHTTLEASLKQLRNEIATFNHQLNEHKKAVTQIGAKQEVIRKQKIVCRRWEQLHVLIGSADGKKYRNFAQGLTFELVIDHANRQLQKLTDRYLLIHDDARPLELNVIDHYQAGEIRTTQNLSGGESFIVSLALALGLAKMASKNVRVDSLFLDEGFGTLDEEALEIALDALSSLRQDGKLIGVISHVPALKERISTQIQVIAESGGWSRIVGPGCRRMVI